MYTDELLQMTAKDLIKEIDLKDPVPNEILVHVTQMRNMLDMRMCLKDTYQCQGI